MTTFDATVLDDGRPALVMELIDGVSLATFASTRGGVVSFDVLRRVARDALAALAFSTAVASCIETCRPPTSSSVVTVS